MLSQSNQPPAELNGSFLSCPEPWLEAAWQWLLGRQFLAHRFIWAGQFALVLRHSDKNVLNHWQNLEWRGGQWLTQHPQGCWKKGGLESSGCQSLRNHRHKDSKSTLILGSGTVYFRAPHSFLHPQVNQEQLGAGLQGFAHCLLCVTSRSVLGWLLLIPGCASSRKLSLASLFLPFGIRPLLNPPWNLAHTLVLYHHHSIL